MSTAEAVIGAHGGEAVWLVAVAEVKQMQRSSRGGRLAQWLVRASEVKSFMETEAEMAGGTAEQ